MVCTEMPNEMPQSQMALTGTFSNVNNMPAQHSSQWFYSAGNRRKALMFHSLSVDGPFGTKILILDVLCY